MGQFNDRRQDALIIVDVQNDFCPGGSLAVDQGDGIVPVLNSWLRVMARRGALIVASRDWHPPDHISFRAQGGPWPEHCVQNTTGAEFHPALQLPPFPIVISKGMRADQDNYSDFEDTNLQGILEQQGVRRLYIGGLALDVCVRATVMDALSAGFETYLIVDATRPIQPEAGAAALREMEQAGAKLVEDVPHE